MDEVQNEPIRDFYSVKLLLGEKYLQKLEINVIYYDVPLSFK